MYAPVVISKTIPDSRPKKTKMGKVFSDQKGPKPLPFPYIREYPLILTPFMIIRLYPVRSAQSAFYN